jgi:hypothetical protein
MAEAAHGRQQQGNRIAELYRRTRTQAASVVVQRQLECEAVPKQYDFNFFVPSRVMKSDSNVNLVGDRSVDIDFGRRCGNTNY